MAVECARHARTTRGLIAAFLLISAAAFTAYELLTFGQTLWWTVLGLASVAAVAAGIVRYRPRPAVPWLLVGAARLFPAIFEARMAELNETA